MPDLRRDRGGLDHERNCGNLAEKDAMSKKSPANRDALVLLERRIHRTYRARVETARRHQARGNYWNVALVLASLTTATVSVVGLSSDDVYGERADALMVVLGIVTLVVSVLVTSAQFHVQAEKFFSAYRSLQRLWVRVELEARRTNRPADRARIAAEIDADYQAVLDDTANHTPADFFKAFPGVRRGSKAAEGVDSSDVASSWELARRRLIVALSESFTLLPLLLGGAMLLLTWPAVHWFTGT